MRKTGTFLGKKEKKREKMGWIFNRGVRRDRREM